MSYITNGNKVIYGNFKSAFLLFLVTITITVVTKVESTVHTKISKGCFRINVGETPWEVTLSLSCEETSVSSYITSVYEISYWRPLQRGDAACSDTGYNAEQCCQMTSVNNPICVTSLANDDNFLVNVTENCENKRSCDIIGLPTYMRDCSGDCSGPNNKNINRLCWSRVIQVTYLCEMEGNIETAPATAPYTGKQTNTATVIVLGVMIPVSFLMGVAACFVFLRFFPALDKKENQSTKYNASSSVSHDDQLTSYKYGDTENLENTYCDADPVSSCYQKDDSSQQQNALYLTLVNSQTVYTPVGESASGQGTTDGFNKGTENTYYNTPAQLQRNTKEAQKAKDDKQEVNF